MQETQGILGFTDFGQPIIPAEYHCPHWLPGKMPTLDSKTCWYCRYADFRKTTDAVLFQSVCRCPHNRVGVLRGQENEHVEPEGGARLKHLRLSTGPKKEQQSRPPGGSRKKALKGPI